MKLERLLTAVLLAAPVLSLAAEADPAPKAASKAPSPLTALNAEIDRMMAAYDKTEDCFVTEAALRVDLSKKKAALAAEFKGAVPNAFDDLLWQKTARVNRWHAFCVQSYDELGRMFDALATSLRTIEPRHTNTKKQQEIISAQKTKFHQLRPGAKTAVKK